MNRAQTEYAALRYTSAKMVSSIAMDVKAGNVIVEQVDYDRLGKRIRKFRCPPGTTRAGKWTNAMGTTCNLGAARATLAKLGERIDQFDSALAASEERRAAGGTGLVRYQAGQALERGGQIVDYLADRATERRAAGREKRKERRLERRRKLGGAIEGIANLIPGGKEEDEKDKTPKVGLTEGDLPTPKKFKKKKTSKKPSGESSTASKKPEKKPTGPAKAAEANIDNAANVNQVNAGKSGKKKPGKQIGNLFTNEANAKGKASESAQDTGEMRFIVQTSTGKLRVVDAERYLAGDEQALFAVGPDGVVQDLIVSADLTPNEIIDDLTVTNQIEADLAAAEAIKPPVLVDKNLSKSKTGKFVPDEINQNMVNELGEGKAKDFLDAFQEQRERNLSFWNKRLGKNAPDTDSADEFLAAIDKHITDESLKDNPDKALIGQLGAERKNFLAMWVPNDGEEDVNPYERLNFVQPKRRHQIIEDAGLSDLIISKSKTKTKPKPKLALKDDENKPAIPNPLPAELDPPSPPNWMIDSFVQEENARTFAQVYGTNTESDVVVLKLEDGKFAVVADEDFDSSVPFKDVAADFMPELFVNGESKYKYQIDYEAGSYQLKPLNEETVSDDLDVEDESWTPGEKWVIANGPSDAITQANSLSAIHSEPVNVVYLQSTGQWFVAPSSDFDPIALVKSGQAPSWPISSYKYDKKWGELSADLEFTPWTSSAGFSADEPNVFETWTDAVKAAETKSSGGPDIVLFQYSGNGTVDMLPREEFESGIAGNSLNWDNPPVAFSDGEPAGYYESGIGGVNKILTEYEGSTPDFDEYGDYGYAPPQAYGQAWHTANDFVLTLQNSYEANYYDTDWSVDDDYPGGVSSDDIEESQQLIDQYENQIQDFTQEYAEALQQGMSESEKEHYEYQIMEAHSMLVDLSYKHEVMMDAHANSVVDDVIDDPMDDDLNAPEIPDAKPAMKEAMDAMKASENFAIWKKNRDKAVKSETTKKKKPPASIKTQEALDEWYKTQLEAAENQQAYWLDNTNKIVEQGNHPVTAAHAYYDGGHYVEAVKASLDKQKKIHEKKIKALGEAQTALADVLDENNAIPEGVDLPTVQPVIEADLDSITGSKAATGIDVLFDLPDYDHQKLYVAENGKMVNFATIMARYDKYGAEADEVFAKLPDNFHELPPEERLKALAQAIPGGDQLTVAKRLARSIVANQYGDKASVQRLKDAVDGVSGGSVPMSDLSGLDNKITKHTDDLAKAQADLDALGSDANAVTKLYYEGKVATARNNLVAAQMLKQYEAKGDIQTLSSNGKALAAEVDSLPAVIRDDVAKTVNGGIDIKPGSPKTKASKTLMSTDGFDSTSLGSMQPDGSATAYSVPVGHKGMWSQVDADEHIGMGKSLADVPDDYLKEAIWNNTGAGKRFAVIKDGTVHQGFNSMGQAEKDKTTGFLDTVTGKKYVIKSAHRNDQEHTQEIAGALLQQSLGMNAVGIRLGSPIQEVKFEAGPAAKFGKAAGDQRAMILEHVSNLFPDAEAVYTSFHDIPAGSQIDPESLARLMVMDRVFNYFDRTGPNLVAVKRADGKIHLQPIDHGNAFQDWNTSGTEQAAGFTKVTKGDNIDLFALTKNMSDEDKEVFAKAMADAVRRYKKTDHKANFEKAGATQKLSQVEIDRMTKHGEWLNARKESLDWDKMTISALSQLGLTDQEIGDAMTPPSAGPSVQGFGMPSNAGTVETVGAKVAALPKRAPFTTMNYDSDQIENFDVRAQALRFVPVDGVSGDWTDGVQFTFKRRGTATDVAPSVEDGWTKIGEGNVSAKFTSSGKAQIDFTNWESTPGTEDWVAVETWHKQLDDGSFVTVVISPRPENQQYMAASHQMVRIVLPGKSEDVTEDRVAKAMEAVGVVKHGSPSEDDIRTVGLRSVYSMMTADPNPSITDEEIASYLASNHGIGEDSFRTVTFPNGRISVELTPAAAKALDDTTQMNVFTHSLKTDSTASVVNLLASGELISSLRRFDHGVRQAGISTPDDMNRTGGGDWLYFKKYTNDPQVPNTSTYGGYRHNAGQFITLPGFALRRTDLHAYAGDAWGNPSVYEPFDEGMAAEGNEIDFRGGYPLNMGILVVSQAQYDEVLSKVKNRGVTEIGGVPLEDILATPATIKEKLAALQERLQEEIESL